MTRPSRRSSAAALAALAFVACRHDDWYGTFALEAGAPTTLTLRPLTTADVEVTLWNAGPSDARCALRGEVTREQLLADGCGVRARHELSDLLECTFTTTGSALIGYALRSRGNLDVTRRAAPDSR